MKHAKKAPNPARKSGYSSSEVGEALKSYGQAPIRHLQCRFEWIARSSSNYFSSTLDFSKMQHYPRRHPGSASAKSASSTRPAPEGNSRRLLSHGVQWAISPRSRGCELPQLRFRVRPCRCQIARLCPRGRFAGSATFHAEIYGSAVPGSRSLWSPSGFDFDKHESLSAARVLGLQIVGNNIRGSFRSVENAESERPLETAECSALPSCARCSTPVQRCG